MRWGRQKKLLIYQYRDYPLYNGTTGFLNGLTLSLPVFFLSHYFPESIVGYFALVARVSRAPVSFISASVSQIHLKKVVDLVNEKKRIIPYLVKITTILTAIVFLPSLIIIIWAPKIFTVIFGENWIEAGKYAQILMPAIAVSFIVSTLSTTIGATNNSHLAAIWRITAFVTTLSVFSWFAPKGEIIPFLYAVLINDIVLYILFYFLILYAAMKPRNILEHMDS
jgi:O-antigen/teichoic acid export membrane protein